MGMPRDRFGEHEWFRRRQRTWFAIIAFYVSLLPKGLKDVGLHMDTINNIQSLRLGWVGKRLKKLKLQKAMAANIFYFTMPHLQTLPDVMEQNSHSHHYHRRKIGSREKNNLDPATVSLRVPNHLLMAVRTSGWWWAMWEGNGPRRSVQRTTLHWRELPSSAAVKRAVENRGETKPL